MNVKLMIFIYSVSIVFTSACRTTTLDSKIKNDSNHARGCEMDYVTVCRAKSDCRQFSRLIMGSDHLAQDNWTNDGQKRMSEEEIFAVLDEAARLGINFIDTAPIYVNNIENIIGKWLVSRRDRLKSSEFYCGQNLNPDRSIYLLSKGGFPFDIYYEKKLPLGGHSNEFMAALRSEGILASTPHKNPDGTSKLGEVPPGTYASRLFGNPDQITSRVSEEFKHTIDNLGDVTVYLMHRDDGDYLRFNEIERTQTPVKTIMMALSDRKISGHYWALGWSNWRTPRVNESVSLAKDNPTLQRPLFNSAYFSLFEMTSRSIHAGGIQATHSDMADQSFQAGIYQNPYSPLGGFSIMDQPEPRWENAKKFAKSKHDSGDAYWQNVYPAVFTAANEARFNRIVEFTKRFNQYHGTNFEIDQMMTAYVLAHKRADFVTVGPINVVQLRRSVASLKLSKMLSSADLEFLYSGK